MAGGLVDVLAEGGAEARSDLRRALAGPLSVAVVASVLGLEASDAATVLGWYAVIVDAVSSRAARPAGPARRRPRRWPRWPSTSTRASPAGRARCWPSRLGSLAEDQVVANAAVLMFGGIETTEGMILNAVSHVLSGGPSGGLRSRRTTGSSRRSSRSRCGWSPRRPWWTATPPATSRSPGAEIARGDLVRVSLAGANRDPAVFPDPDVFDPAARTSASQLAFASGPHVCVAMDLARLETRVALRTLVTRFRGCGRRTPCRRAGWCSASRRRCGCEGQSPCEQGESCSSVVVSVVAARIGP